MSDGGRFKIPILNTALAAGFGSGRSGLGVRRGRVSSPDPGPSSRAS